MTAIPGFIGPSGRAQSPVVDVERTVNLFLEKRDVGLPKAKEWLYATPGLRVAQVIGAGPHRASFTQDGRAWVISGAEVYEVFATGTSTLRGTVAAGIDQGTIVSNGVAGDQLLIVIGSYGYVYDLTDNTVTLIADDDFPSGDAIMCGFLDGYGIVLTETDFQLSALEDFSDWDALDVAQKSQTSDKLVSMSVDIQRKVVSLRGTDTTEYWWDSGAADFPFEPVPNSIAAMGCVSPFGVADGVFLSQNAKGARVAYAGAGVTTTRVSTHGIEDVWALYDTVADCVAFRYDWKGHPFHVFTFPSADATWVYDGLEQVWHEWLDWDESKGAYRQQLALTHMYVFDTHFVGSRLDGTLYEMGSDVFTDGSQAVRRMRRSPHVTVDGKRLTCSLLEFQLQVGVGLSSGQGSDPTIMLRLSRNGGRTWGSERWASLGAMGNYLTRVIFRRNGQWRDGAIELTISDPVVTALIGCDGTFEATV